MFHELNTLMKKRFRLTIWLFLIIAIAAGQTGSGEFSLIRHDDTDLLASGRNELTIFVIPSKVKFDWSSPSSLFRSYFKNFKRNLFKKKSYTLGHAFIALQTPLSSGRIFAGMRAASGKELKNLVLKDHYGLAILGADTEGKLENEADLVPQVKKYSRKGQLAFMTFFISDEATERLLQFFHAFKAGTDSNGYHGARYGGAFWPRFEGEGSGCSAFAVSFLDLAGLLKEEFAEWMVRVNIPMDLIGGPYNNYHEVRFSDIKKYKSWAESSETAAESYEPFGIYDPTIIYEWIEEKWEEQNSVDHPSLAPLQLNQAKGILIDSRNHPLPDEDSIFMERNNHSIFIDYYHQKY
jgi:hypothetical protein